MTGPAQQENVVRKTGSRERQRQMKKLARALFSPHGKNPYVFNGKPLTNLQELTDYLVAFTGREGLWVASWLEYLGGLSCPRGRGWFFGPKAPHTAACEGQGVEPRRIRVKMRSNEV